MNRGRYDKATGWLFINNERVMHVEDFKIVDTDDEDELFDLDLELYGVK